MDDRPLCLECGLRVGATPPSGCLCPPPSIVPRSRTGHARGPYREAEPAASCPRCEAALRPGDVQGSLILDCSTCGGVFVARDLIDALDRGADAASGPVASAVRVAFPVRARVPEPREVRYLPCPVCGTRMNRTSFARGANVVVDVCKEDGIWFDAGEVHAVLDFVEAGGLDRARRRAEQDRAAENDRLRKEWRQLHDDSVRAMQLGRGHVQPSRAERELAGVFFSWLWR